MLVAQVKAMKLCDEMLPNAKIGPAPNISYVYPASCKPEDNACPEFAEGDEEILKAAKPDFIGFNYCSTTTCEASLGAEENVPLF